ncbi:unannotated protein [freshwater metagenome]|uniref:Unannotated protein n=1 Tax=freshwater metagenome TaxID=449393 RepID=A0A6J6VQZ3_9ZZZZ|nr:hypothetical protein [Actinomycetota bacterium]
MKKMTLFLAILILSRIGIAYGADLAPNGLQNFFLGSTNASAGNINQVLALLVGPEGPPGPAGVAGRDGFVGMNGVDGMPGAPGATGEAGPQGAQGVPGVQGLPGATGATGPQGVAGATGATGGTGPQGPVGATGADGGISLGYANGTVSLNGCDDSVKLDIGSLFTPEGFKLKSIKVSDINPVCPATQKVKIYVTKFPCETNGEILPTLACSQLNKVTLLCTTSVVKASGGAITVNRNAISRGDSTCVKFSGAGSGTDFFADEINGSGGLLMEDLYRSPKLGVAAKDNPAIGVEITE